MRLDLITLFPDAVGGYLEASIVGRARRRGLIEVTCIDPRAWAGGRHKTVDDRPFGGGPGMVLAAPPLAGCLDWALTRSAAPRLLMTSPAGRAFDQAFAADLAGTAHVVVLCGHYEGIDQRIIDIYRPEAFSVGDYVLSGGELAALVLVDAVTRLIPGALGNAQSAVEESFQGDGFDHPCYTRPREFRGLEVPPALTSGDHAKIAAWRAAQRAKQGPPT
jgi:tRNA (guanine37-N1)-methyltransferase